MSLDEIPRIPLANLPTPLEAVSRLAEALDLKELLLKRDDLTGLAMGGNKARKLEFLMAEARSTGADVVITTGGVQSNHARMTAAAASRLGMKAILFLTGKTPERWQGNLLLDTLLGAEVHLIGPQEFDEVAEQMAEELRAQGHRPYIIPIGGSTSLGCLGYVWAVRELKEQLEAMGKSIRWIVHASGSGGTQAGMALGVKLFAPEIQVIGISIARPAPAFRERIASIASEAARRIGEVEQVASEEIWVEDAYIGPAYGVPTPEGNAAVMLAARREGLLLDPVYTGKALAGLQDMVHKGIIPREDPVLFWHTGGTPALFAFENVFGKNANPC